MQQIVINCNHGAFGLSRAAIELYLTTKGINFEGAVNEWVFFRTDGFRILYSCQIERDDPVLVDVIRQLGDKANDRFSELKIVEIPDGVQWEICEEEGGIEYVTEAHRVWK